MILFRSRKEKERKQEQQRLKEQEEIEAKRKAEKKEKELIEKSREYVLTISASDYVAKEEKSLVDYDFRSVFSDESRGRNAIMRMMKRGVEIGAEVIVDVRIAHEQWGSASSILSLFGTALIPKK